MTTQPYNANIQKLAKGDADEWETAVNATSPQLFALFKTMLGADDLDTRELINDVYVRAFKYIANYRGDASFKTWLSSIATNVGRDYIKKNRNNNMFTDVDQADLEQKCEIDSNRDDAIQNMQTLIPLLQENYQNIILLYYIEQKKYEDIAKLLNMPMGTVKTLLYRAKRSLRQLYVEKYGE
jgi:RNA polymerase sigma-70 factor, ECF subfamily